MLAAYLHDLDPVALQLGEKLAIRWYGVAYVLSFLLGWLLYRRLSRRGWADLPEDKVADFITFTALFGVIVGGRLGYVLFYGLENYLRNPLEIFQLNKGGMASHGGILGIVIFTWFYARRQQISWTNLGDNLCVVAPIGLFVVRLANFINGELWGRETNVAWAMQFPQELESKQPELVQAFRAGVPGAREQLAESLPLRHPSQLYEAFFEGAVLFAILWWMRTRLRLPNGVLTGAFFVLYAVFRIGCEQFREPDSEMIGPLTKGQFLSLFMILIGGAFIAWGWRTRTYPKRMPGGFATEAQRSQGQT